jgi:nitrite reductase (NADH) large subunit
MTKKFRCLVCGFIYVGDQPPRNCPICGSSAEEFAVFEDQARDSRAFRDQSDLPGRTAETKSSPAISGSRTDLRVVIIGAGIAGLACAQEIRSQSSQARIALVGTEPSLPYYRLNLTRYLAGEVDKASLTIHPRDWYDDQGIDLHLGQEVVEIDRAQKQVVLRTGSSLPYDKLVMANGAHPFIPPITGSQLANVLTVRTIEDVDWILQTILPGDLVICIGGGILGLEMAGAIARRGIKVTVLEGADWLMPRQLNPQAAEYVKKYLAGIGLAVREKVKIKEITGHDSCTGVSLDDGETLAAKYIIVTAGVRPNSHLALRAGLTVNKGVVVDNHLRTSDEAIFAAGDVCEHYGVVYGLWPVSQYQGKIAAQNVLGLATEFGGVPMSNVLKVLGLDLFSIGEVNPADSSYQVYTRATDNGFVAIIMRDGKMAGGIVIGDKFLAVSVKQAVEGGTRFPDQLYNDLDKILARVRTPS